MAKRTASARKAVRSSVGRTFRNKSVRSSVKTSVVRVRRAVTDQIEGLSELGLTAIANLDRAASKGILHRNNAARRKSRLMKALNAAAAKDGDSARPAAAKSPSRAAAKAATQATPARDKAATKPAATPTRTPVSAKAAARPAPKASAVRAAAKKAAAKKPAAAKTAAKKAAPKKK